jgi:propanol-preferring alcohol dehydrogenase
MQASSTMKAMVLEQQKQPLVLKTLPVPEPLAQQVLVKIIAYGVCRTDLHITNGELTHPKLPLIIGHEIVGAVAICVEQQLQQDLLLKCLIVEIIHLSYASRKIPKFIF